MLIDALTSTVVWLNCRRLKNVDMMTVSTLQTVSVSVSMVMIVIMNAYRY